MYSNLKSEITSFLFLDFNPFFIVIFDFAILNFLEMNSIRALLA